MPVLTGANNASIIIDESIDMPQTHTIIKGDIRTPIRVQLRQGGLPSQLGANNEAKIVADDGTVKRAWSDTGVTTKDAAKAELEFTFAAADVDTAGVYWLFFRTGTTGGPWDTFPTGDERTSRKLRLQINDSV